MATNLETKIGRIRNNVTAALAKIAVKGVSVPEGAGSDDLEGLIDAITGGGGLPDGVSAMAGGTFTPAADSASSGFYDIEHGMGATPNFYILGIKGDIGTEYAGYLCLCYCVKVNISNKSVVGYAYSLTSSDGLATYSIEFTSGMGDVLFSDAKFSLYINNRPLKAGVTYTWICGMLDGIA